MIFGVRSGDIWSKKGDLDEFEDIGKTFGCGGLHCGGEEQLQSSTSESINCNLSFTPAPVSQSNYLQNTRRQFRELHQTLIGQRRHLRHANRTSFVPINMSRDEDFRQILNLRITKALQFFTGNGGRKMSL